jgi:hypothetical protein
MTGPGSGPGRARTMQEEEAVRALNLLGELAATLLDIIYQSEEKERVLPLLGSVMYNVVPYLRHHAASGSEMLCAGSRLLASLSEYPYTRSSTYRVTEVTKGQCREILSTLLLFFCA